MANTIEEAKSGRATCRTCRQKIDKGVLRFGEEIQNQFDPDGQPGYFWHHLECAAKKKPPLVRPVLAAYTGSVPKREEIEKLLNDPGTASTGPKSYPYADRAPTGRAKCIQCDEAIEKGAWRVAIEREVDTGSFTTKGPGYLHPGCAIEKLGAADPGDLIARIKPNSLGLTDLDYDELTRDLLG